MYLLSVKIPPSSLALTFKMKNSKPTQADIFKSVVELQTEVRLMKEINSSTVRQFKRWALVIVVLEVLNLIFHGLL